MAAAAMVPPPSHSLRKRPRRQRRCSLTLSLIVSVSGVALIYFVSLRERVTINRLYYYRDTKSTSTITSTSSSIKVGDLNVINNKSSLRSAAPASCRYHGNCPANTVCEKGACLSFLVEEPIPPITSTSTSRSQNDHRHDQCVTACLEELTKDERFYHGTEPHVVTTYPSKHPLQGCVVQFKTQRRRVTPPQAAAVEGTFDDWVDSRFRRVVRVDVDPNQVLSGDLPLLWNAYCSSPCVSDRDCPSGTECIGRPEQSVAAPVVIHSEPKSCHTFMASYEKQPKDMVVVTGSNTAYYSALQNFAASLKYWSPDRKLVIYNLGMSPLQLKDIKKWTNVQALHWESGIPSTLPPHVNDLKNYAWKSIIMNETVHEYKSIFWLDAGATFTGPIDSIEEIVHRNGIFLVRGQDDDMKRLSHAGTYSALGYDKDTFREGLKSPHYAGGIQGHVYPSRFIESLVIPNARCALDADCIAPRGSSLSNHRYDQTSLSILAYQSHVQAPHYTEYLAAGREQLNPDLSKVSEKILWTSRGSCDFYYQTLKLKSAELVDKDSG